MRATRSHAGDYEWEKPSSNERDQRNTYVHGGMTVSTTEPYAGNGPRCADNREVKQPVQGRLHDQIDNGSKQVGNGPEFAKKRKI